MRRYLFFLDYNSDYYVGEMRLGDTRRKRNVIFPWKLKHSMILFRGKVFEWGIMNSSGLRSYDMTRDPSSCKITWRSNRESYSSCTLSQVENWTRNYGATNTYNLFRNNCHMFVNKLAKYLYDDCATK